MHLYTTRLKGNRTVQEQVDKDALEDEVPLITKLWVGGNHHTESTFRAVLVVLPQLNCLWFQALSSRLLATPGPDICLVSRQSVLDVPRFPTVCRPYILLHHPLPPVHTTGYHHAHISSTAGASYSLTPLRRHASQAKSQKIQSWLPAVQVAEDQGQSVF